MALSTVQSIAQPRPAKNDSSDEGLFDHDSLAPGTEAQARWGDEEPARVRR